MLTLNRKYSERGNYCHTPACKYSLAMDHSSTISSRISARRTNGTRINCEFCFQSERNIFRTFENKKRFPFQLTVEEYVHALETLVNDFRFTVYNVCYKRVLCVWILFAFSVLLGLLFSGLKGIALFSLGVGWLFLNAAAIFLCMWVKMRLARGLERCLASVNKQLLRHKIILVLDDRGKISCHKVNLCFMYFDPSQCVNYLNDFIERSEQSGTSIEPGWESRLDVSSADIVIQGSNPTRVSRKQVIRNLFCFSNLRSVRFENVNILLEMMTLIIAINEVLNFHQVVCIFLMSLTNSVFHFLYIHYNFMFMLMSEGFIWNVCLHFIPTGSWTGAISSVFATLG